jgi:hypothetical protein
MTTFAELLEYAPETDILTDALMKSIASSEMGKKLATEIANLEITPLAKLLSDNSISSDNRVCGQIAAALLEITAVKNLKTTAVASQAQATIPQSLSVTIAPEGKKSFKDLLASLKSDPTNADVLFDFENHSTIAKIYASTTRLIGFYGEDGLLDVGLTQEYIELLAKGNNLMPRYRGKRPQELQFVLNGVEKVWQHPLFENEVLNEGVDLKRDMNWNPIDVAMIQAILWARLNHHDEFPASIQVRAEFPKIQAGVEHWGVILHDYKSELRSGNPEQPLLVNRLGK